jgi:hypothetical protein
VTASDSVRAALEGVRDLYTKNLAEHGFNSKSVGWKDEASQLLRFGKLTELIEADAQEITVNDWGSGYGAMFDYLSNRLGDRLRAYRGYDISSEMHDAAQARVTDTRASFLLGAELSPADYAFVSGTFNVRFEASDDDWDAWVKDRLRELAASSARGFSFNLLSSYVDWKEPQLFYADPREYFDFCKRELSPSVSLLHDYPLYEWTILVRTAT